METAQAQDGDKRGYCYAQVGERLCGNREYKNEYCYKHYKMFGKQTQD